jgi:hypothetical protein
MARQTGLHNFSSPDVVGFQVHFFNRGTVMAETQGKGQGEGAVERNTSRPNEQGVSGGGSGSSGSQKAADNVQKIREQTRDNAKRNLGK